MTIHVTKENLIKALERSLDIISTENPNSPNWDYERRRFLDNLNSIHSVCLSDKEKNKYYRKYDLLGINCKQLERRDEIGV